MAAIVAGESELRRSMDAWTIVPKLARRLSWVSALALVLAVPGCWDGRRQPFVEAGGNGYHR